MQQALLSLIIPVHLISFCKFVPIRKPSSPSPASPSLFHGSSCIKNVDLRREMEVGYDVAVSQDVDNTKWGREPMEGAGCKLWSACVCKSRLTYTSA